MRVEEGFYVAESKDDFSGWEILHIEDFKIGIKRLHVRLNSKPSVFRLVYCADEFVPTEFRQVCI